MIGRTTEASVIVGLALVLTIAVAVPVLRAPSERIFGMEIVGRHHDPFTVMEQFNRPRAIGPYMQPLTDIPGALLARTSGSVAGYNWLVLLSFPLSAAAAYALARYLALSPIAAALAAIAFAFSPFHLAHAAYHPHIAQTQWIPLYFLALWRCLDNATWRAVALLAGSIVGVTLSNFYGGLIAAVMTPIAMASYWFFTSRAHSGSRRSLAITIGSLVVVAVSGVAYARYAAAGVIANRAAFGFERDDLFRYSAKWWGYLVPPVEHPLLGGIAAHIWDGAGVTVGLLEQQVSLGWGVVALGCVAIVTWVRHDRNPSSVAAVPTLAAVAFVALVCSLSPERTIGWFTFVRPSSLLYSALPMFRSYARFGVVVQLMAALLAGIGAERVWRSGTWRARVACVALLVLAAGEYAVWPPALWRDVLPTPAHRWVARQPGPVHALDCAPLTAESESIQWLTGFRISLQTEAFDDCTEPNFADKLSAAGYSHMLVRREAPKAQWLANRQTPEGLQVAARFTDGEVFAVTARAPVVYTAQMAMFYSREYDDAWTWRWMGPEASWTIVNTSAGSIVASVDIDITAFHAARPLMLLVDGIEVQTLTVGGLRQMTRMGPFHLLPGDHKLVFRPRDPPTVADDLMHNGDRRPLSFALGEWHWLVQGEAP